MEGVIGVTVVKRYFYIVFKKKFLLYNVPP